MKSRLMLSTAHALIGNYGDKIACHNSVCQIYPGKSFIEIWNTLIERLIALCDFRIGLNIHSSAAHELRIRDENQF